MGWSSRSKRIVVRRMHMRMVGRYGVIKYSVSMEILEHLITTVGPGCFEKRDCLSKEVKERIQLCRKRESFYTTRHFCEI